jgi:phosphate-selective porin OprO and OprP
MPELLERNGKLPRGFIIALALGVILISACPASDAGDPGDTSPEVTSGVLLGNFGPDGYTLATRDGANVVHLRANLSVDGRYFSDSGTSAAADTWLIRRLRPTLEGTLEGSFDFRFMPDFAQGKTVIQDAWADLRVRPWLIVQFGKFKAPVGLERLQLEQFARFIELSLPSDLLPYRDLGLAVGGSLDAGVFAYNVAIVDGTPDGGSSDANPVPDQNSTGKFTVEGRVFSQPLLKGHSAWVRGLGVGLAMTEVCATGIAAPSTAGVPAGTIPLLPTYKTPGQQVMFTYRGDTSTGASFNNATFAHGLERRLVPQFFYYYRSFGLLGEYVTEDQRVARHLTAASLRTATLNQTAWQIQGAWFLTGEQERYDTARPRRNFDSRQGGPGAWELIARYHEISFDRHAFDGGPDSFASLQSSVTRARAVGAGVNWYLNLNVKVQLDYEVTRFQGGGVNGNRPAERVLLSQFAVIF